MVDSDNVMPAWERLRHALGAAGIGTWHLDLATGIATYDEGFNQILGLDPVSTDAPLAERLAGIHPADRGQVEAAIAAAIEARGEFTAEFRIVRPDGSVRWLRDRGRIAPAHNGHGLIATGAVIDVTERRRAEEQDRMLAEATQVLAAAVDCEDALSSILLMLAARFASRCSIHLLEGEQLRLAASAGDDRLAAPEEHLADVSSTGQPVVTRHSLLLPLRVGGETLGTIACLSQDRAFDEADHTFATELAGRIALSIDRDRLFQDLERANRVKDEFLATLSHELRTPLNAVLGWTRMLRRGTIAAERTATILETIERNAAAQMQLVEELLDLSAMTAGGLRLNVTRVDLRDLIGGAVETVRPAAEAKSLRLNLSVRSSVGEVAGDPARLRQVLWNLLANAVKFTPAGGSVDVTVVDGAADVEITVRDTGPGIPPDFLPHVFEPFRQGDSSASRTVGGLGLGLAIVRHIVEAHGGTAMARSDGPDLGSVFSVRLPTGRVPREPETSTSPGSLRGRRVLAVDDDESTQELVATMLLMYGVSVRTAGRAAQALHILSEWQPDVLLTDIAMPGEDGYALMRRIRSMPPPLGGIPAVALTAYTDPQSVQNAFAAGFDAHLGKPLEPHVLADALAKVLRVKRTP